MERELDDRTFLTGSDLALGEIPLAASLYRYFELDIERPALPRVEAWPQRLCARPAHREHVMIPFAELKGRLAF